MEKQGMKEASNGNDAYDVVITGFGYINRIREVAPSGAQPCLACDIALLEGVAVDGDYSGVSQVRLSAIVKGREAVRVIRKHFTSPAGEVNQPWATRALASVACGGLRAGTFTHRSGGKGGGGQGIALKTSLLSIKWLKIDDTVVDLTPGPLMRNGCSPIRK